MYLLDLIQENIKVKGDLSDSSVKVKINNNNDDLDNNDKLFNSDKVKMDEEDAQETDEGSDLFKIDNLTFDDFEELESLEDEASGELKIKRYNVLFSTLRNIVEEFINRISKNEQDNVEGRIICNLNKILKMSDELLLRGYDEVDASKLRYIYVKFKSQVDLMVKLIEKNVEE